MRGARLAGDTTKLVFSFRWIPEKDDNGQIYFSLRFVVHPDVSIGFDVRPLTDSVGFLATWRALEETERRPALVWGTSNDDFTVGGVEENSQALYGMLAKNLFSVGPVHVAPYAGAAWIFELEELRPLGGVNLGFQNFSTLVQYSGTDTHLNVSYRHEKNVLSFIYWGLKYPGLAYTRRF